MRQFGILLLVLLAAGEPATAATLYLWTDASGTTRYGYQPPPGAAATPAETERLDLYGKGPPPACPALAEQHLRLIDAEIARTRGLAAGLGPGYELSPAAKQALILDLLAHRAAVLTGRRADEFRSPSSAEMARAKSRLEDENARLRAALQAQDATIDAQKRRLDRARRPWSPPLPVIVRPLP